MSAGEAARAPAGGYHQLADGLMVTRFGFGSMQLPGPGVWGPPRDHDEAISLLKEVVGLGITHIDTSGFYGPAVANHLIREALQPYPVDLVIATKVGVVRDPSRAFVPAAGPEQLREQVKDNLGQLGLKQLDMVYLRVGADGLMPADPTPFAESFGALLELQQQGLIRCLGLSGASLAQLEQARDLTTVAAVQNRYHLLDRASAPVLAACEEYGIAFVPYFPLAAGMLRPEIDRSQLPPGLALTDQQQTTLDHMAASHSATRSQIALAWLLHHSPTILPIPGTSSITHLAENVGAVTVQLTTNDLATLDALPTN